MYLQSIHVYPIKSLKGVELQRSFVQKRGLRHDRRYMLVDNGHRFMSQRQYPEMSLINTSISDSTLTVSYNGGEISPLNLPIDQNNLNETATVTIWDDTCLVNYVSQYADEWFSDLLDIDCRLVYMKETANIIRKIDPKYALTEQDEVSFADGYPYLIIGSASLDDLNARLQTPILMNRFRPNIVINTSTPFIEDTWKRIKIGEVVFDIVKPCARCKMTTINQETAEEEQEPLKTLSTYRLYNQKILFGQNMISRNTGIITKQDHIEVLNTHTDLRI